MPFVTDTDSAFEIIFKWRYDDVSTRICHYKEYIGYGKIGTTLEESDSVKGCHHSILAKDSRLVEENPFCEYLKSWATSHALIDKLR
jgi:hypothetical protein